MTVVPTQSIHVRQRKFYEWVKNANDEEWTIPTGYYKIDEIIAMFNTMSDTTFSIYTKNSSYGWIWIQSPNSIDFTNVPDTREILGLGGRTVFLPAIFCNWNVIDITRNRLVILVYLSLVRFSDL